MNWLPTKPGWLERSGTPRAKCEYHGTAGQQCRNEPTHLATWPSRSHSPMTRFYCGSHVASAERIPGCRVQAIEGDSEGKATDPFAGYRKEEA